MNRRLIYYPMSALFGAAIGYFYYQQNHPNDGYYQELDGEKMSPLPKKYNPDPNNNVTTPRKISLEDYRKETEKNKSQGKKSPEEKRAATRVKALRENLNKKELADENSNDDFEDLQEETSIYEELEE